MRIALFALLAAGGLAALSAPGTAQPAGSCRLSLRAEAEAESFAGAAAARTAELARDTGTAFAAAASNLCGSGVVTASHLRPFSRLLVRNAEGAAKPNVYDDAEESPGALIVEYAFAASGVPAAAAIEEALRCWRDPQREGCTEEVSP